MGEAAGADNLLVVVMNGDSIIEYDRTRELPKRHLEYLDRMDQRMDQGVSIGEFTVESPNSAEKATFVANNLIQAIHANDEPVIAAACAYLAIRLPELKQVRAEEQGEYTSVDLVFDKDFNPEVRVDLR